MYVGDYITPSLLGISYPILGKYVLNHSKTGNRENSEQKTSKPRSSVYAGAQINALSPMTMLQSVQKEKYDLNCHIQITQPEVTLKAKASNYLFPLENEITHIPSLFKSPLQRQQHQQSSCIIHREMERSPGVSELLFAYLEESLHCLYGSLGSTPAI